MHQFTAQINIIGINPFVFVPDEILLQIFEKAGKDRGPIPVKGTINKIPYKQTLVKYSGHWRLYINTSMLKNSPKRIGETIDISVAFDKENRDTQAPAAFVKALSKNKKAGAVFESLSPSRRAEIARYLANLKKEETLQKNIERAIRFLSGEERFMGRDKP